MAQGLDDIAALARPARPHAGRLDAAERPAHPSHRDADRRDRHDLRKPPECRRRCRRALPQIGQRRDPARRVGEPAQCAGNPGSTADRPARRGAAGSLRADRAHHRPRLCRGDARGRRADRPDHPARRQVPGRARAARGARAGAGPCRGALPHLCPCRCRPGDGARDRGQRQDAPHRRLRRHRDPADRRRHRALLAA